MVYTWVMGITTRREVLIDTDCLAAKVEVKHNDT